MDIPPPKAGVPGMKEPSFGIRPCITIHKYVVLNHPGRKRYHKTRSPESETGINVKLGKMKVDFEAKHESFLGKSNHLTSVI